MKNIAVAAKRILVPGRTCWAVAPQTSGGLLIDGRDYYRAFYRAASAAKRFILLCGWQFDVDVPLLRGKDRREAWGDPHLLPFLKGLMERNPALEIRMLCWDYSPAYFFQREWFQDYRFNWSTPERLKFRFDDRHAVGASHHQKFIVIDGALAFLGSMDLCNDRWDERKHPASCEDRLVPLGEDNYGPYHEVQAAVTGPVVAELVDLFRARWRSSGGDELVLPKPADAWTDPIGWSVRLPAAEAGLSRTVARTLAPDQPSIREIRQLYRDAIASAERSIFIENQYFGSTAIYEALLQRMMERDRPPLNIVLIYPEKLHSLTEELSMGKEQSRMFRHLTKAAERFGHQLRIYYGTSVDQNGRVASRYIHSKVLSVDDRFLTVGSANTNNRSMGLDTELNVSWEAGPGDEDLRRAIRRARVSLLAEHACVRGREELRSLYDDSTLVESLDRLIRKKPDGLRPHPMTSTETGNPLAELDLDPERPVLEEEMFERLAPSRREWLKGGLHRLRRRVFRVGRRRRIVIAVDPPTTVSERPPAVWHAVFRWTRRLLVPALVVAVGTGLGWLVILLIRAAAALFKN